MQTLLEVRARIVVDASVEQTEQEFHYSLLLGDLFELVIDVDFTTFSELRLGTELQEGYRGRLPLDDEDDIIRGML